jgi:hypothetical protein
MSQINVKLRTKFYDFYDEVRGEFETDNDCIKAFIIKEKEEGNQTFTISLYKKYLKQHLKLLWVKMEEKFLKMRILENLKLRQKNLLLL